MKFTVIVALLALACCSNFLQAPPEQEPVLQGDDVLEILKCLVDKAIPLVPEVVSLIEAINEKDFAKVISIAQQVIQDGKAVYLECFEGEKDLAFRIPKIKIPKIKVPKPKVKIDHQCLVQCGYSILSTAPSCIPYVNAIKTGNIAGAVTIVTDCLPKVPVVYKTCKSCFRFRI